MNEKRDINKIIKQLNSTKGRPVGKNENKAYHRVSFSLTDDEVNQLKAYALKSKEFQGNVSMLVRYSLKKNKIIK